MNVRRQTPSAIQLLASLELALFLSSDGIDHVLWNRQSLQHVLIEHPDTAAGDGPHRELFVPGKAKLADEEYIERSIQGLGDFEADGNAAARQSQNEDIGTIGIGSQLGGQMATGFNSIAKDHD
jgi:hypothetical protein